MAKMQANQMRAGMVIEFEGQRYTVLKQNIMIPGKGALPLAESLGILKRHGYDGYGTADGIDYSERLALLLTQELAREVEPGLAARIVVLGCATIESARLLLSRPLGSTSESCSPPWVRT